MCLLAICDTKSMPKDYFEEAFESNKDGFGFAFREKGKITYKKGFMKIDEAWEAYSLFLENVVFPHVVHFRLGTPVCEELTHPFEITSLSELSLENTVDSEVLFHNGIVTGWRDRLWDWFAQEQYIPDGKISDTRVVAGLMSKYGDRIFEFITGKFVVFGDKRLETFGEFTNHEGIRYSNDSYKPKTYYTSTWGKAYQRPNSDIWNKNANHTNNQLPLYLIDEFLI